MAATAAIDPVRRAAVPDIDALPYPPRGYAWTVVCVLMLASLVSYLDRMILNLLVDPVRHDLGITDTQVGLLQGLGFTAFYSTAGLWFGSLVDRHNRRTLLAVAIGLWSVMTISCGLANSFGQLFIGRVGVAVGEAALMPAAYSMLSDLFHPHQRGKAAGVFGTGMAMGNGLSVMISGLFVALLTPQMIASLPDFLPHVQWKLVFIAVGLIGVPTVLLLLAIREPARLGLAQGSAATIGDALRFVGANKGAFAGLLVSSAALLSIGNGLAAWGPTILIRQYGWTPAEAGFAIGATTLTGGVLGPLIMGWLSDRFATAGLGAPRLRAYLIGGPGSAVAAVLVAFGGSVPTLLAGNLLVMLFSHGFAMLLYTATQDIAPAAMRGKVVAVSGVFINVVGISMGPLLVAMAGDYVKTRGLPLTVGYGIASLPMIVFGTLVAWLSLKAFAAAERRIRQA